MISRRNFVVLGAGAMGLAACDAGLLGNGIGSNGAAKIDARVDATRDYLYSVYPNTRAIAQNARGILYMPLVTEMGIGIGGSFGRGALRINDVTVDYYSATSASIGLQIGAQQYAHAIFFMTDEALQNFRRSNGWVAGAGVEYATPEEGGNFGKDTTELDPVTVFVFGQQGLIVGATIEGVKYSRIIP